MMPFAAIHQPSLALGILKASLLKEGISCSVRYANLAFAEVLGLDAACSLDWLPRELLVQELIFAGAAFPEFEPDLDAFARLLPGRKGMEPFLRWAAGRPLDEALRHLRRTAAAFVDRTAAEVVAEKPRIVGCSSVFLQHCACLALLRRVRQLDERIVTVLGGGNCAGPMGVATRKAFPWVDFVVAGDADLTFPAFCRAVLAQGRHAPPEALPPGVLGACHLDGLDYGMSFPRSTLDDLDASPVPDYSDYFAALERSPVGAGIRPGLVMETSRGCWWGEKAPCTFCGFHPAAIAFRSKSGSRALDEFLTLASRHGLRRFAMADSILDKRHLQTVLPGLRGASPPFAIFYETTPRLDRAELSVMAEAGVRWVLLGIESLDPGALRRMHKGTTVMANVQTLKWALQSGIWVNWSLLVEGPGDTDQDYAAMATDRALTLEGVVRELREQCGVDAPAGQVLAHLEEHERLGISLHCEDQYLALAVAKPHPPLPDPWDLPRGHVLDRGTLELQRLTLGKAVAQGDSYDLPLESAYT